MWRAEDNLKCHSSTAVHLFVLVWFLETGSFTGLKLVKVPRLAGHQVSRHLPTFLCFPSAGIIGVPHLSFWFYFYVASKDLIQVLVLYQPALYRLCHFPSPTIFETWSHGLQASLEFIIKLRLVSNSWLP